MTKYSKKWVQYASYDGVSGEIHELKGNTIGDVVAIGKFANGHERTNKPTLLSNTVHVVCNYTFCQNIVTLCFCQLT